MTINTDVAGIRNIIARRNNSFVASFTLTDDADDPIDLTGYTLAFVISDNNGGTPKITHTPTLSGAGNNVINVNISHTSLNFNVGPYEYELNLTSAGGIKTTQMAGKFILRQTP
jgi:hypothetical protein